MGIVKSMKKTERRGNFVRVTILLVLLCVMWLSSTSTVSTSKATNKAPRRCMPTFGVRPMKARKELGKILEELNFTTGVEVGVSQGNFAAEILTEWKSCKTYKLIDLWAHQENYIDVSNVKNSEFIEFFNRTKMTLKPWQNITEYYRMYSTEAAKQIQTESLDFAYIDARHDYCGVMEDLEAYWPLVKPGGIMAGHDYHSNDEVKRQDWSLCLDGRRIQSAVKGAVNDFFIPKGYTISVTYNEPMQNWFTWIVQKSLCD